MRQVFFIIAVVLLFIAAFIDVAWTNREGRGPIGSIGFGWAGLFFWALSTASFIS